MGLATVGAANAGPWRAVQAPSRVADADDDILRLPSTTAPS